MKWAAWVVYASVLAFPFIAHQQNQSKDPPSMNQTSIYVTSHDIA